MSSGEPAPLIERRALDDARRFRFSPAMARQFEADTGAARARSLVRRGLLGLGFYLGYLGVDWLVTPDVMGLALALRLGLVTPLGLGALYLVSRGLPPAWREGLMAAMCVLGAAATVVIMMQSDSPLREHHHHALVLVVLYLTVVLRLRFAVALAACGALLGVEAVGLAVLPEPTLASTVSDLVVFAAASTLCLIAAVSFERNMHAAYGFSRAQQRRAVDLEDLNRHDPLTGLGNRRGYDAAMADFTADPELVDLGVVTADVDFFKSYNDTLGHPAGDVCLKRIAALLSAELRGDRDVAIRYGGEEFVVLLPDADLGTSVAIAERMRRGIEAAAIPHPGRPGGKVVTVTFGAASGRLRAISPDELMASADAALYAAKHAGRNQVWPRLRRAVEAERAAQSA